LNVKFLTKLCIVNIAQWRWRSRVLVSSPWRWPNCWSKHFAEHIMNKNTS